MAGRGGRLYRSLLASGGGGITMMGLFPILYENPDKVDPKTKTARSHIETRDEMTGADRLKLMFSYDGYGNLSPELSTVIQAGLMGLLTGSLIGGTIHSRENYLSFMERNQGTAFQNMLDAQKQLQTKVTVGFGRGAFMWGWRLGLFSSSFMLFTSAIAAYRGKTSVIEYTGGGAIAGAVYKFKHGPKPAIAGGVVAGGLGTLAGLINMALLYLTGTSTDQLRNYHYEWQEKQQKERLKHLYEARERDTDALSLQHHSKPNSDLDSLDEVADTPEPNKTSQEDTSATQ